MINVERRLVNQKCLYSSTEMSYDNCPFNNYVRFHSTDFRKSRIHNIEFYKCMYWIYTCAKRLKLSGAKGGEESRTYRTRLRDWCADADDISELVSDLNTADGILASFTRALQYLKINRQISKMKSNKIRYFIID